ncbi:MAG: hypothetical protein M1826_002962 [Phylliscum demangeonii]|nr:MAG: hypothetical protein M1826_002962 [Phylliscum demangeonii]
MAQFDEFPTPLLVTSPLPTPYQSLRIGTFSVGPSQPNVVSVLPHSSPNWVSSGLRGQTVGGELPTIDIVYPGSTVKSFDLQSLYFGCAVYSQVTASGAIGCTVQVTGKKAGTGATVGPELINFAPANSVAGTGVSLQSPMAFASFSDLKGLSSVTFQIVLATLPAAQQQSTVFFIDDVVHTNHE